MLRLHQRKVKCCASLYCTLCPDAAAVPVNNPLDGRQSHASSGEIVFVMKTLEGAEKPVCVGWVESRAVVPNIIGGSSVRMGLAELNTSSLALRGELPGIPKQVLKRDSY